ncbi:hypothetical protein WSK_0205 [Novosphingobium sp. Rr 2-17]|uniref:hypothetical protein n=1 Tax=Novosphingobium sp. Rr 2-17 TaxID=555793 RepID=UPI000269849D|nr:hypothetical protein [Novosphingobium sp. Rr 2-17]EIZ81260.1 hypothetical protein WSK_0205 [Novosphingobium sp. Rr 2-17]
MIANLLLSFPSIVLLAAGWVGAALLRRSWLLRDGSASAFIAVGWAVLGGGVVAAAVVIGPVKGTTLALVMEAIGALGVVWGGRVRRKAARMRDGEAAPEPLEEQGRLWRGVLRALLAGPLGMTAALAVALCFAVYLPGDPRTRIVISGLLMPVLWGLAMTWTLADRRLLRATAVLVCASLLGVGIAALGGAA